jgi:hypothetical protein
VQSSFYWSATTSVTAGPSAAWDVNFGNGDVGFGTKDNKDFVWCVRGGQGVDPQ